MKRLLFVLSAPLLLAACGDTQMASVSMGFMGSGEQSLSLIRQQTYYGSEWKTELIVANLPDCQRRHLIQNLAADRLKMDVYRPEPGVFILNAGKRWYVTALKSCEFQQYKEPPPEPGELVGVFQARNGGLEFVDKTPKKPATPDPAQ